MAEMVKSFPAEGAEVTSSRRGATGFETPSDAVAGRVASDAKQAASQVAEQAKDLVSQKVTEQAGRSAGDIREVAQVLRRSKRDLGDNMAAPYVDKAADQLERFSRFLSDANPADVVRDVERFARREPLLFLGGAFALGLLGARFLKSSARHNDGGLRVREHDGEDPYWASSQRDQGRYGHGSSRRPYGQEEEPGRGADFTSRTSSENKESFLSTAQKGREGNGTSGTEAKLNVHGAPNGGAGGGS